jgi:hypothetical protein
MKGVQMSKLWKDFDKAQIVKGKLKIVEIKEKKKNTTLILLTHSIESRS